jgi:hypothetical protein
VTELSFLVILQKILQDLELEPIVKDKLFFFETLRLLTILVLLLLGLCSPNPSGQVSAPTFTEMTALSNYLQTNFNYDWSF